jgi:hypothetical protein
MKIFTDEFKEFAAEALFVGAIALIFLLLFGIAGGIEQGLIF